MAEDDDIVIGFLETLNKMKGKAMAEKKKRLLTPPGYAKWAHIQTPKAPFDGKGEPKFQIDICFSPDHPEWKIWALALKKEIEDLPPQLNKHSGEILPKQMPIKRELGNDEKPTGRFYVTFKTGAQFKPGIFDKFGKPIPDGILIGNESLVRVNYTPSPYEGFGGGIALYLNAVQVLDLIEYKSQNAAAYGFEVEEMPKEVTDDLPF